MTYKVLKWIKMLKTNVFTTASVCIVHSIFLVFDFSSTSLCCLPLLLPSPLWTNQNLTMAIHAQQTAYGILVDCMGAYLQWFLNWNMYADGHICGTVNHVGFSPKFCSRSRSSSCHFYRQFFTFTKICTDKSSSLDCDVQKMNAFLHPFTTET